MSTPRHLGEIPGKTLFGRTVRPMHFTLALSCLWLAVLQWIDATPLGRSWFGELLGPVALTATVLLTVGWWGRWDRVAEWGLVVSAGAWAARAVLVVVTSTATFGPTWLTAALTATWSIGAAGATVLEMADRHHWASGQGADVVGSE